jgi:predicted MFS family arabinose efflux permease
VREPEAPPRAKRASPLHLETLRTLGREYFWVVAVGAIFTLGRFSEAFLVLRAGSAGIAATWVPLVMVAMNVVYSLAAYPFGKLADTMSRVKLLAAGLVVLIASDLVLANATRPLLVVVGVVLWGIHLALTQGLLSAMVAHSAPAELRGTAFGVFNLVSGVAMLVASAVAGLLWDARGAAFTFYVGAAFSGVALLVLVVRPRPSVA